MEQPTNCFLGPTFLLTFLKNSIHCETQQRLLQIKRIKNAAPITTARHKDTGPFFMKLRILGDIHKICISGKIFAFHRSAKDILEHLLF